MMPPFEDWEDDTTDEAVPIYLDHPWPESTMLVGYVDAEDYDACEVGEPLPPDAFVSVAECIAANSIENYEQEEMDRR